MMNPWTEVSPTRWHCSINGGRVGHAYQIDRVLVESTVHYLLFLFNDEKSKGECLVVVGSFDEAKKAASQHFAMGRV
jgi:hypothetical protein